jgi:thioredoxin-dependent peroxiredoxin
MKIIHKFILYIKKLQKQEMQMIESGSKAPDFELSDQDGNKVSLKSKRGKNIILYFYPKDDTPGCTKEACNFRDELPDFQNLNAEVLGISADTVDSHKKFAQKYRLNFPLLSDSDKKVVNEYGVWREKNMYGKKIMGIERTTFIIDREGVIRKIFRKVKVDNHNQEVMEALTEL